MIGDNPAVSSKLPQPFCTTQFGGAYLGDSLRLLKQLPPDSIDLIVTSPPFALTKKTSYGN